MDDKLVFEAFNGNICALSDKSLMDCYTEIMKYHDEGEEFRGKMALFRDVFSEKSKENARLMAEYAVLKEIAKRWVEGSEKTMRVSKRN